MKNDKKARPDEMKQDRKARRTGKLSSLHMEFTRELLFLLAAILVILWLANSFFLERLYLRDKEKAMKTAFDMVNLAAVEDELEEEDFLRELEKTRANGNLSVMVFGSDGRVILSTLKDSAALYTEFLYTVLRLDNDPSSGVIESTENYVLQEQEDRRLGEEYLVLWGTLDDGSLVLIRSAVEDIRSSVAIANRFLAFTAMLAVLLGVLMGWFMTKRITRPIEELRDLSLRMTQLDFGAKYRSRRKKNEVDELGECMNAMSETLEKTILELKQANDDLQQDIRQREENERRQKEFIANVSHELKTPIALIQGYAEGLQEDVLDDPADRAFYCDVIRDEAVKMNHLVLSMISLDQIESGSGDLSYERFDLSDVIGNMLPSFRILFEQNGIDCRFAQEGPVYVHADEYLIEQVISNYISNAIHYAKGEKRIEIRLEKRDGRVRTHVFNTGDPIAEEVLPHLWDKFYKGDKAHTRAYGGSGIGLSLVKAVMEEHHQKYGVENLANGVDFWFELEDGFV